MVLKQRKPPIYYTIAGDLENEITIGTYEPGDRVPSMRDTAERYGVTLKTVQEAYRLLRERGRVATTSRGTVVAAPTVSAPHERIATITHGGAVLRPGESAIITDTGHAPEPPVHVLAHLGLEPGAAATYREYVICDHNGNPIAAGISWFQQQIADRCPALLERAPIHGGAITAIKQATGIATTDSASTAQVRTPTVREVRELRLGEHAMVMVVSTDCLALDGTVTEYAEIAHPPGYVMSLRRRSQMAID